MVQIFKINLLPGTYEIEIVQTITHKARTDSNLQQAQVKI
jgi:hypothetical protein